MGAILSRWHAALAEQSPAAVATVIEGPEGSLGGKILVTPEDHTGSAGNEELDRAVVDDPGSSRVFQLSVYAYLGYLQESLLNALPEIEERP